MSSDHIMQNREEIPVPLPAMHIWYFLSFFKPVRSGYRTVPGFFHRSTEIHSQMWFAIPAPTWKKLCLKYGTISSLGMKIPWFTLRQLANREIVGINLVEWLKRKFCLTAPSCYFCWLDPWIPQDFQTIFSDFRASRSIRRNTTAGFNRLSCGS